MSKKTFRWAVLILGIILSVRLLGNIANLANKGGRVTGEQQKLLEAQLLNKQLQDKLSEVQTPQYMEREAREKLGYGKPGEIVLVLPEQDTTHPTSPMATLGAGEPNWALWRKLYLGF
jgi:hypothetical protein